MSEKPPYEELEQRVKALEKESEKLKHSEKALRESEERFRLFSEASFEGIAITEKEVLIEANEQFAAMFGYGLFEVVGMQALDFVAPESQNLVLQNMKKGFQEPYEFLALKNDGSTFEAEVHGKAIFYEGRIVRVAAIRDISKRKQAESAMEESEEKYRKVVENINVGMTVVQDLKFVFVNHTISTFLGYSQDEILSNPNPFQFIHPDDTEMVFERHMKRIENDNDIPDAYSFRVVTKDGDVKWVEVTAARINWEGKLAILNFFMDITERKLAAEKLEELNSIINRSPVVVFLWENETNWPVEFVSENVEEVFGYTAEEFITGRERYADIVHPDDLERVIREVTTFSQEKDKKEFVHEPYRIITRNREIRWIDDRTHIRRNRTGDITHYRGIVLDITDRYLAEEALQESRNTLNGILFASPVGIGLVENRVLKWANESFLKMFGFESEEEYRDNDTMMLYATEDEYHRVENSIYSKLKSGKPADEDTILKRKDGSVFNGHVKMSCHDPSNPMEKAIMTISDISWRKRVETERINKEKLQGVIETAGAVCHEFNQPLQAISGYADLLIMDIENDHPYYDKITKIKSQVDRMGDLTQKLMGVTRYETMEYLKGSIIDIDKAAG